MTPAYQIEPGRCKKKITVDDVMGGKYPKGWICEEKTDDCRYLFQIRPNGAEQNYLTSRRISKTTNRYVEKQDWMTILRDHEFPASLNNTVLDGGLFDPTKPRAFASDVIHAMKQGTAHYRAFDLILYKGEDVRKLRWLNRRALLVKVIDELDHELIGKTKRIKEEIPAYLKKIIESGGEGIVLKDPHAPYGTSWTKVKRKSTYDVIIQGYEEPTSEIYAKKGWFGALRIGQYVQEAIKGYKNEIMDLGQVKNMTDELRAKISASRAKYIGGVIEISAETRLTSGKFRNPSVIQLRDDKNPADCTYRPEDEA